MKRASFNKDFFKESGRYIPVVLILVTALYCFCSMIISPLVSMKKEKQKFSLIDRRLQVTNQAIVLDDTVVLLCFVPVVGGDVEIFQTDSTLRLIKDSMQYVHNYDYSMYHLKSYLMSDIPVTHVLYNYIMFNTNPNDIDIYDMHYPSQWKEFIDKLCERTGRKFRLPTNAEWEYAAKGGKNQHGFTYSGSNEIDEVANYEKNTDPRQRFIIAKTKKPNELGLYDMSGSVWELTSDLDKRHSYVLGNTDSVQYPLIARGGCYVSSAEGCAIAAPGLRCLGNEMVGVRLVLEY